PATSHLLLSSTRTQQLNESVHVKQTNLHGKSLRACFTPRCVILGASLGGSKTTNPLISLTGGATCKPRRARSDKAWPRDMLSASARLTASFSTSSSIVRVVLMSLCCVR